MFKKLTFKASGKPVYINLNQIQSVQWREDYSEIQFRDNGFIGVRETPEEIIHDPDSDIGRAYLK